MKLPGPKAAAQLSVLRPVPTAIDAVISAEDVLLLEYTYSDRLRSNSFSPIIKQLGVEYGAAIPFTSLRHAIMALAAQELPVVQFGEKLKYHMQEARGALRRSITTPEVLCDADAFAACLLALIACDEGNVAESMIHAQGSMAIMKFLSDNAARKPLSNILNVFGPFISNTANYYYGQGDTEYPVPRLQSINTTFQQRITYLAELSRFRSSRWQSVPPSHFAVNTILRDLFGILLSALQTTVLKEMQNTAVGAIRQDTLRYVNNELSDPLLQEALGALELRPQLTRVKTLAEELTAGAVLQLGTIHLMLSILDAASVLEGLGTPRTILRARRLVSASRYMIFASMERQAVLASPFANWYGRCVAISGLAFPSGEIPDRKSLFRQLLTFEFVPGLSAR